MQADIDKAVTLARKVRLDAEVWAVQYGDDAYWRAIPAQPRATLRALVDALDPDGAEQAAARAAGRPRPAPVDTPVAP